MTDQLNDEYSKNIYFRNFCDNLDALGLTYAEVKRDYKYSGGTNGPHKNYFDLCFPMNTKPEKKRYCLCDHFIKDNCYLSKDFDIDTILIVGNCCIFINGTNSAPRPLQFVFSYFSLIFAKYAFFVFFIDFCEICVFRIFH